MKRFIALLIVAILLCSTIFVPTFAKSSPGVKEEYLNSDKWLSLSKNTSGARYFVDMKGNPVHLFGQARAQSHASDEDLLYSDVASKDALFEHYADYGCNFTRLAINSTEITGGKKRTPEEIQEFITKRVDPDVQAIIRNGMYVMLDVHMYAPTQNTTLDDCMKHAYDYFQPLAVELAKRYKDEPMVAVIELWNEPVAADNMNLPFEGEGFKERLRQYFIDTVAEIRKYDTRHVLLVSDHNAGWGGALPEMWRGYYDKVDPIYNNTCFSVHACDTQLDRGIDWYKSNWFSWANEGNICLLFGEIETEDGIATEKGIQNFCDMLTESAQKGVHFSGLIWRPHGQNAEYHNVWGDSGWAKKYCTPVPKPLARYASEAEDTMGGKNDAVIELVKAPDLFGYKTGTGISMKPNLKATAYYESEATTELIENIVYKEGKYDLIVRACGNKGYDGDFIVGYRDIDGVIHQIARFGGKNTSGEHYYQKVSFTAAKKIVSFVYFGCETAKKSAVIDRVYLVGAESDNETSVRSRLKVAPVNQVIDLSGKKYTIKVDTPVADNNDSYTDDGEDYNDSDAYDDSEQDNDSEVQQVVVKSPDKTTLLRHKIINHDATALTVSMFIALGVLVALGVFILVYFLVKKKKNKINIE